MGVSIDRWASTVRLAMEAAAAEHLALGAARISTEAEARGTSIVLEPGGQDAAGLRVFASDGQIDVEVIPTGAVFEIWQPSEQERLETLRRCVEAVVAGRYEEGVELVTRRRLLLPWRKTTRPRFWMTFSPPDGEPLTSTREGSRDYGPKGRTRFRAYG
jgi:hypothetical protein